MAQSYCIDLSRKERQILDESLMMIICELVAYKEWKIFIETVFIMLQWSRCFILLVFGLLCWGHSDNPYINDWYILWLQRPQSVADITRAESRDNVGRFSRSTSPNSDVRQSELTRLASIRLHQQLAQSHDKQWTNQQPPEV